MKVLLHICCAPCAIFPVQALRDDGWEVMGFFYRHNIHPYTECMKRQRALESYAESIALRVIYQQGYELEEFIRHMVYREHERCAHCYHDRLRTTALIAKRGKFDCFSSTLLYSKRQNQDLLKTLGDSVSAATGVDFLYQDFSRGWQQGIAESKRLGLYRQQYCGCIYSEKERYYRGEKTPEA